MKYFLPELHVQLNSRDEDLADAAEEEIDRASDRYNQRWAKIKADLPRAVVRFYEEQFLHDADVFAPAQVSQPGALGQAGDVVVVAQQINTLNADAQYTLAVLRYGILEAPSVTIPLPSEVFRATQPTWLYDEFDLEAPGIYSHRILLSDGRVISITFHTFHYEIAWLVGVDAIKALGVLPQARAAV